MNRYISKYLDRQRIGLVYCSTLSFLCCALLSCDALLGGFCSRVWCHPTTECEVVGLHLGPVVRSGIMLVTEVFLHFSVKILFRIGGQVQQVWYLYIFLLLSIHNLHTICLLLYL